MPVFWVCTRIAREKTDVCRVSILFYFKLFYLKKKVFLLVVLQVVSNHAQVPMQCKNYDRRCKYIDGAVSENEFNSIIIRNAVFVNTY